MAEAISGATGALQGTLGGALNKGQAWLDSIFPPETRNEMIAKISKFATEKPAMASFIASQVALTGFPLGLFAVMTISVIIFALIAGLIIGLLGAVLFIVAAVGFALIILLPTLFFTTAAATFIWLWGMAAYWIVKKFNKKEIPGIHTDGSELSLDALKGKVQPQGQGEGEGGKESGSAEKKQNGKPSQGEKKGGAGGGGAGKAMNGAADKVGSAGKSTGVDVGNPKEAADVGKHAGKATNAAQNTVGGAKGAVGGAVGL